MKIDVYEKIPGRVAREIQESGAANTFVASDGSAWLQCDRCERWIAAEEAVHVHALLCEIGYTAMGFPVNGGGTIWVCRECATKACPCENEGTYWCPLESNDDDPNWSPFTEGDLDEPLSRLGGE